ncbi:hypothetical protein [Natronosalvus caseinilyticus]|uniref:hypothetical protein n=1 Tax=Natronosalvus caseinilyticus TaxID=2953747 RepID=UPI0028ACA2D2|nr:hypothetical protein [Natronosalvus caseinilyticus]
MGTVRKRARYLIRFLIKYSILLLLVGTFSLVFVFITKVVFGVDFETTSFFEFRPLYFALGTAITILSIKTTYWVSSGYEEMASFLFDIMYLIYNKPQDNEQVFNDRESFWKYRGLKSEYIDLSTQYIPTVLAIVGISFGYTIMLFGYNSEITIQTRMFILITGTIFVGCGTMSSHISPISSIDQKARIRAHSLWLSQTGFALLFVGALLHTGYIFGIGISEFLTLIISIIFVAVAWRYASRMDKRLFD